MREQGKGKKTNMAKGKYGWTKREKGKKEKIVLEEERKTLNTVKETEEKKKGEIRLDDQGWKCRKTKYEKGKVGGNQNTF